MTVRGYQMVVWQWGEGSRDILVLPGAEEALLNAAAFEWLLGPSFSRLAQTARLTVVGRRMAIPPGYTTRQMADDVILAVEAMGLDVRLTIAVAEGGALVPWLCAHHPALSVPAVLLGAPLSARPPGPLAQFLDHLIQLLGGGAWAPALEHLLAADFDPRMRRALRPAIWLVRRWGRPADLQRALRVVKALRSHDARPVLGRVSSPILAISGGLDPLSPSPAGAPAAPLAPALRPRRHVWLAGGREAIFTHWETVVMPEILRFMAEHEAPEPPFVHAPSMAPRISG